MPVEHHDGMLVGQKKSADDVLAGYVTLLSHAMNQASSSLAAFSAVIDRANAEARWRQEQGQKPDPEAPNVAAAMLQVAIHQGTLVNAAGHLAQLGTCGVPIPPLDLGDDDPKERLN